MQGKETNNSIEVPLKNDEDYPLVINIMNFAEKFLNLRNHRQFLV